MQAHQCNTPHLIGFPSDNHVDDARTSANTVNHAVEERQRQRWWMGMVVFTCILLSLNQQQKIVQTYTTKIKQLADVGAKKSGTPSSISLFDSNGRNSTTKQKVVLFAGPHKTASTSIQHNLFKWLSNKTHPSGLANTWAWPSPLKRFREKGCNVLDTAQNNQNFHIYWWVNAMRSNNKKLRHGETCMFSANGTQLYTREKYLEFYQEEFYHQWRNGYSLVIASEAMDDVGNANNQNKGNMVLESFIQQLPWNAGYPKVAGSDDDITAVVVYRSPRSDHLQSIWHQCCMEDEIFDHFLATVTTRAWFPFHYIDSLNLAKRFLDRGLKVVLIDMAGVVKEGYDISNIVACDILGADCTTQKYFYGDSAEKPIIANTKNKTHSVTPEQMKQIDAVIENYDCNFLSMAKHPNLTVLYPYALDKMFAKCNEDSNMTFFGRDDAIREISKIAKNAQ